MRHYDPPNLREAESTAHQCSNCTQFYFQRSEEGALHGECLLFDTFVRGDFTCDAWTPYPGHEPQSRQGPAERQ